MCGGLFSAMNDAHAGNGTHDSLGFLDATQWRTTFARYLTREGMSPTTVEMYTRLAGRWITDLRSSECATSAEAWFEWTTPAQMRRVTGYACRAFERFAKTTGIEIDLGVPRHLPPAPRPRPRAVTDGEFRMLLTLAKTMFTTETGITVRVWLRLLDSLGARRSESIVSWDQINLDAGTITVYGKTGARTLPLSRRLRRVLRWLHRRRPGSPWQGSRGRPLGGATLYKYFKRLARAAGMPRLRPHLLRHRRLTAICRSDLGKDQLRVLRFAGQRHLSSLQYYYEVGAEDMRDFVEPALAPHRDPRPHRANPAGISTGLISTV